MSVNLDNFLSARHAHSERVLTSPRSLRACKALGVRPVDLLPPRVEDYVRGGGEEGSSDADAEGLRAFEGTRQARARLLRLAKIQRHRYARHTRAEEEDAREPVVAHPQARTSKVLRGTRQRHALAVASADAARAESGSELSRRGHVSAQLLRALAVRHRGRPETPSLQTASGQDSWQHHDACGRRHSTQPFTRQCQELQHLPCQRRSGGVRDAGAPPEGYGRRTYSVFQRQVVESPWDDNAADEQGLSRPLTGEDADDAAVAAVLESTSARTQARLEKALLHPSNLRQNVGHTFANRARWERAREERQQERREVRVQRDQERKQRVASMRREEVKHLHNMRRHVEQRMGIASVRHHPAFVSMGGDHRSCFFASSHT